MQQDNYGNEFHAQDLEWESCNMYYYFYLDYMY